MTVAAIMAGNLGRGLDAMRELAGAEDYALAIRYSRGQLRPAILAGLLSERPHDISGPAARGLPGQFSSFRFEYRLTSKGRDFLAALDRPAPVRVDDKSLADAPRLRLAGRGAEGGGIPAQHRPRVPVACRHEIATSEGGLVLIRLYDRHDRIMAERQLVPEEEAEDFAVDFDCRTREARAAYRVPNHARRG